MKIQSVTKLVLAFCCCAMLEGQLILGAQPHQDHEMPGLFARLLVRGRVAPEPLRSAEPKPKRPGFFDRLRGRGRVAPAPERPFDDISRPDEGLERPPVGQAWGDVDQVLESDPSAIISKNLPNKKKKAKRVSFHSSIVDKPLSPEEQNEKKNKKQIASFRQLYINMYKEAYAGRDQSVDTWYEQTNAVVDQELLLAQNMPLSTHRLEGFNNFSVLHCLNLSNEERTEKEQDEINQTAMQVVMDNVGYYDEGQMKTIWSIFFPEPFVPKPSKSGTTEISPLDQAKSQLKKKIEALGIVKSVEMVREFQSMLEAAMDVIQNKQKALSAARETLYNKLSRRPIALSPQR